MICAVKKTVKRQKSDVQVSVLSKRRHWQDVPASRHLFHFIHPTRGKWSDLLHVLSI